MKIIFAWIYTIIFSAIATAQDCTCGVGIGAYGDKTPVFQHTFSNQAAISICGYTRDEHLTNDFSISEFSVFDCSDLKRLASYSALHSCKVSIKNDTVVINRMGYFYNGPDKKWKPMILAQRAIYPSQDSLHTTEEKAILSVGDLIFVKRSDVLQANYADMNYEEMSVFLGQLEILALREDPDAIKLLFSKALEEATIAATAEHLLSIRATYNWVIKDSKEGYWW